jgi:hypothetical protein
MTPFFFLSTGYLLGMATWLALGLVVLIVGLKLRRRWKREPKKLRFVSGLLSLWFLLAGLTGVELYFALFYDQTDSFSTTNVSQRWYHMHVEVNNAGFRDPRPLTPSLPEGVRRIAFVGDSFTFGHGVADVADRFSDQIAVRLEAERPGRFAVSNLSLPGLDTRGLVDGLLPEWIAEGIALDVFVYVFVLNDIEYFDERTADFYQQLAQDPPGFFLLRDTYFFNLLYSRLSQLKKGGGAPDYYSYLEDSYTGPPWDRLERKLDQMRSVCAARGIDLRLAVFPFLHNLGPDYPFAEAHRRLTEYCRRHEIPVVDLAPVLEPHRDQGLTVNRYDAHPNERAHRLAADAIYEHLLGDLISAE